MDQYLEVYNLSKFTQEEIYNSNRPISISEIELIINNYPKQKAPDSHGFTCEYY